MSLPSLEGGRGSKGDGHMNRFVVGASLVALLCSAGIGEASAGSPAGSDAGAVEGVAPAPSGAPGIAAAIDVDAAAAG